VLAPQLPFQEVWPEVEQEWIDTISTLYHVEPRKPIVGEEASIKPTPSYKALCEEAIHVLDKLNRKSKYGTVAVNYDSLINMTHLSKRDIEQAVAELRECGFLDHDGTGRDSVSLNPAKKNEIGTYLQRAK
jgi:hypothetical protein